MIDQLAQIALDFSPGTAWNYSVSIGVLGYLVEKLSGSSFGEFLRTRLFEPLGMNDTAFWVPSDKTERFTSCYQPEGKGRALKLQDDARESIYAEPPKLESSGGGLVSTAHDYLRFCLMMLNGGTLDGVQIRSPKTVGTLQPELPARGPGDSRHGGARDVSADPATPGSAFPSAAGSTSTWPEPVCPVRSANISGAALPRRPSGSIPSNG
jgi:CubicO group peptidase (beta-lactamase class C family)